MAYLAMRGSGAVNGVSRLHGEVSRAALQPLFPRWPEHEVPVGHVTNGVHMPTLGFGAGGRISGPLPAAPERWLGTRRASEHAHPLPADAQLWRMRNAGARPS